MGKGTGKGKCGDSTRNAFETPEGRVGGNFAITNVTFESLGVILNCWPAWAMCHLPCGCCLCFWLFVSGITSLVGSSIPSCCQKNAYGLSCMTHTATSALVLRVIVLGVLSAELDHLYTTHEDYDNCRDKGKTKSECKHLLVSHGPNRQNGLEGVFEFAVSVTVIYMVVSALAVYFGFMGQAAEDSNARESPVSRTTVSVNNQNASGGGGPIVIQASAVPVQASQVQYAQPQPYPVAPQPTVVHGEIVKAQNV